MNTLSKHMVLELIHDFIIIIHFFFSFPFILYFVYCTTFCIKSQNLKMRINWHTRLSYA